MEETRKISITTGSWVRLIVVLALTYALFSVAQFILLLITAIVIASAIEPVAVWAGRRGIPRLPSVISVYIFIALFLSLIFYFLLLPLIGEISAFIRTLTVYSNAVVSGNILSGMFQTQNIFGGFDTPTLVRELSSYLNSFSEFLSRGVLSSLSLVFGGVVNFIIIIVLSFYLAVQDDGVGKFLKIVTPLNHESYVTGLWKRSQRKIGYWLQGEMLLGVIVAVLVYIGLTILGVEHALLLAVLAGILELIPLFGPVIAAIPAVFVAYVSLGLNPAIFVIILYVIIQQLENHILYPMVVKKMVGLPPMISIIALVVGGHLAGFLGVIVAVPVAAVIMELLSDLEENKVSKIAAKELIS